jgi:5-methylcytosine-specific restriction endonuclease McrA
MPEKRGTAENLKIYFMAHLGLAGHVVSDLPRDTVYASGDQVFRLTNIGREVTRTVLDDQWPSWRGKTVRAPVAASYATVESYFTAGVGEACPTRLLASEPPPTEYKVEETVGAEVGTDALESLKELPEREYKEGLARLVKHVRIERLRSPALVKEAKKAFRARHRRLFCEACGFDFERRYGQRGRDYIEAHHRIPISKLDRVGPTTVSRKDLALVCANCHRMLHRSPWISVEALQKLLSGN